MDLETELEYEDVDLGEVTGVGKTEFNSAITQIQMGQEALNDNVAKNTRDIQTLFSIAKGNNQFAMLETEQAYTARETANGAEIFDEQYAAVTEIKGSTVADSETNTLKHAFIKAIKSTGRNLFNPSTLLQGKGWTERDGVYTGNAAALYNITLFENVNGGNMQIALSVTAKNGEDYVTLLVNFEYTDGSTDTSIRVNSIEWKTYNAVSDNSKTVKRVYASYGRGYAVSIKDFCVRYGTNSEYEPYTEDVYELPQELIDRYPDGIPGYDTFFPQTGEITQQTRRLDIDGVNLKLNIQDMKTYWLGLLYLNNYNGETQNRVIANNGFCTENFNSSKSKGVYLTNVGNTHIAVWFNKNLFTEADISTTDKLNDYLKSLADAGNTLTVEYKLASPTTKKIENEPNHYKAWKHGSETIMQGDTDNSVYGAMPTITQEYFSKVGANNE